MEIEKDEKHCPQHGPMTHFDHVTDTETGAMRKYRCQSCAFTATVEVPLPSYVRRKEKAQCA